MYNRRQHRTTFPRWALPHTGARIETRFPNRHSLNHDVAPHAGARIEISAWAAVGAWAAVAPHAGARIEICKTRSGRHERKVAPHALGGVDNSTNGPARCGLRLFRVLRAVQMRTVFSGAPCLKLSVYRYKWDGDTAPTRNTALVGGLFHRTVAGKAKPAGWRVLASVLCVVIGSVVARCFIFPAGRAASTRLFRGFACGW